LCHLCGDDLTQFQELMHARISGFYILKILEILEILELNITRKNQLIVIVPVYNYKICINYDNYFIIIIIFVLKWCDKSDN
jgi:hypothetical protein